MGSDLTVLDDARVLLPGGDKFEVEIPEGICVRQIIAMCVPLEMQHMVVAWNHGNIITDTDNFVPRKGDKLLLTVVPQGGKNKKGIIGAILTIVVAVVAWYVAPLFVGGSLGGMAGLTGTSAMIAQGVAAGLTMLGTMAISAMIGPPKAGLNGGTGAAGVGSTSAYTLTGQSNAARPYQACFVVYGMHKIMPALAANPNIDNMGTNSQIMAVYDFGLGYVNLYDIRIGETPAYNYAPQFFLHQNSYCQNLQYNFNQIGYDQYSILLNQNQWETLQTKPETIYADLDMNLPRGIYQATQYGAIPMTIELYAEYRRAGTNDPWQSVPIDRYYGGSTRYKAPPPATIQVSMKWDYYEYNNDPGIVSGYREIRGPIDYNPATTPGQIQAWLSEWRAWRAKYEVDNPWNVNAPPQNPINAAQPPVIWEMKSGQFRDDIYYARYPDVAAWHAQAPSFNTGWYHFTNYGGYEGRDPYEHLWYENKVVVMEMLSTSPYWIRVLYPFPYASTWEVRIMRTDPSLDGSDFSIGVATGGRISSQVNQAYIALMRSYKPAAPLNVKKLHTMLEMNVRATDQLNGVVQNLSAVAVSVLQVTNNGVDFWWAETRNPAWIVLDILTSEKNPRPLSRSQVDWPAWIHLANVCDTPRYWNIAGNVFYEARFMCDIVVDTFTNVKDLVESILSGCHASLSISTAGLWTVLVDEEKSTPRQLITPANSWGFSGARTFSDYPHALRVSFLNRNLNWVQDEVIVYYDGYNASNATKFENLDTYGITDYQHAWAYGRYMLAQGIQRSELFTISMDIENLVVQRGDRVEVAYDVPKIGGYPCRVAAVQGNQVWLPLELSSFPNGYSVRLQDGTIRTGQILYGQSGQGQDYDIFTLDNAAGINPDDLIVVGDLQRTSAPYLVQRISAGADLTAELTLCKYSPGVYSADQGMLPPWDPNFSRDFINGTDLKTENVTITWSLYYADRRPKIDFRSSWVTTGWNLAYHNVYVVFPTGETVEIQSNVEQLNLTAIFDPINAAEYFDVDLRLKVLPISGLGFEGIPGYADFRMTGDHTPPKVPMDYGVNVQKEQVGIFWRHSDDPDIEKYMLRFTPEVVIPNWDSSQLLAQVPYPGNSFTVGARTGTYMIRVMDTSGNQSDILYRRTTVAHLPDINYIAELNDALTVPPWQGYHSNTERNGSVLQLKGPFGYVNPEGYYLCSHLFDMGQPYECRIASMIRAYGVSPQDYMSAWAKLSDVPRLSTVASDFWDAWLEVRTSDELSMMKDWVTLASINPISSPLENQYSPWRGVRVGDFTGRIFQFRIQLRSYNPYVRTVVSDAAIQIDMPDRIDGDNDIVLPAGTVDIDFLPPFRVVPSIAVTIDGNPDPVVAEVTQKTESGFTVGLRKITSTGLGPYTTGKIDWMAKGYGRLRPNSI